MATADAFDTLAHQLLDELEDRHDQLLAELDDLNRRVDAVLGQYTQVQPDSADKTLPSSDLEDREEDE